MCIHGSASRRELENHPHHHQLHQSDNSCNT
uniref:Uncharacterized protein n=1 Tax=Rhizophora mucronata TaxID=61149 RepID=A0A2P2QG65_RHIMU